MLNATIAARITRVNRGRRRRYDRARAALNDGMVGVGMVGGAPETLKGTHATWSAKSKAHGTAGSDSPKAQHGLAKMRKIEEGQLGTRKIVLLAACHGISESSRPQVHPQLKLIYKYAYR